MRYLWNLLSVLTNQLHAGLLFLTFKTDSTIIPTLLGVAEETTVAMMSHWETQEWAPLPGVFFLAYSKEGFFYPLRMMSQPRRETWTQIEADTRKHRVDMKMAIHQLMRGAWDWAWPHSVRRNHPCQYCRMGLNFRAVRQYILWFKSLSLCRFATAP